MQVVNTVYRRRQELKITNYEQHLRTYFWLTEERTNAGKLWTWQNWIFPTFAVPSSRNKSDNAHFWTRRQRRPGQFLASKIRISFHLFGISQGEREGRKNGKEPWIKKVSCRPAWSAMSKKTTIKVVSRTFKTLAVLHWRENQTQTLFSEFTGEKSASTARAFSHALMNGFYFGRSDRKVKKTPRETKTTIW